MPQLTLDPSLTYFIALRAPFFLPSNDYDDVVMITKFKANIIRALPSTTEKPAKYSKPFSCHHCSVAQMPLSHCQIHQA